MKGTASLQFDARDACACATPIHSQPLSAVLVSPIPPTLRRRDTCTCAFSAAVSAGEDLDVTRSLYNAKNEILHSPWLSRAISSSWFSWPSPTRDLLSSPTRRTSVRWPPPGGRP